MIHTGKEAAAGKSAVQRKIVVKYLFFKANAELENAFKKTRLFTKNPVLQNYLRTHSIL